MKRVLITGASGFIGRHCVPRLLERAEEVHVVSSTGQARSVSGVHLHQADLLQPEVAAQLIREIRPTHLLHLAWYTRPDRFWQAPENLQWLTASLELQQQFARGGGQRIVTAGTCAEYDWSNGLCHETITPIRPGTPYGRSKAALYWASEALASTHGLSLAWARLFFLYGPGAPAQKFPAAVYHALAADQPALCTDGRQERDFLFTRDAADALVGLLASDIQGPVNVASGTGLPLANIATEVARQMGRPDLLRLGALPSRPQDPPRLVADVTRLRDELGWRPSYSLEQGVAECLDELARTRLVTDAA